MQLSVEGEIATYEYDCKGTSRRADMLTDDFRHECDARGGGKLPVRTARPSEQWSAPVGPTPTTLERINGEVEGHATASKSRLGAIVTPVAEVPKVQSAIRSAALYPA
jgi:hypothetical protein